MVITSIEVEDRIIKLNQSSLGVPNIFDIDSVSLIVGNNGTGKTYFLKRVLEKFTPKAKQDRFSCEIYLSSDRRMSFQDMRGKWGAVYYSPIPYGPRIHATKNLIDASPNWARPLSVFDLKVHSDILSEFKISPKVYARKIVDVRKVCRIIIDALVIEPFPRIDDEILKRAAKPLLEFLGKSTERESKKNDAELAEWERSEKKLIDQTAVRLYHELMDLIADDMEAFCIFAAIEYHINTGKKGLEVVKSFVSEVLRYHGPLKNLRSLQISSKAFDDACRLILFFNRHSFSELKIGSRFSIEIELESYDDSSLKEYGVEHLLDVGFQEMSSGQLAILAQLSLISDAIKTFSERNIKRVLLLIDEGDAFLHLEWQRKYIDQLNRMLASLKNTYGMISVQLVLATHSPLLATDVPKELICRMDAKGSSGTPSAFAAPLHELLNQSFGAKTVGEFASKKINEVVSNISKRRASAVDDFIISSIDNPIIKAEVLRRARHKDYQG